MSDTRTALEEAFDKFEDADVEDAEIVDEVQTPEDKPDSAEPESVDEEPDPVEDSAEPDAADEPDESETPDDDEPELPTAAEADEEQLDSETDPDEDVGSAPQGWRPEAREGWKDIPPAARAEIQRREQDIETKLGELSDRSHVANRFNEAVKPFEQTIAIEANGDAIAATQNLMGVATRLRFGTPQEKAALVSQIVQQYGIDIEALDTALSQNLPPGGAQQPPASTFPASPPAADPRVDQMWSQMQQDRQQAQQTRATEVEQFLSGKEWGEDVRNDMADLIELASRRGEALTLETAYVRAVAARPDIQNVLRQRASATPSTDQESLKRKKRTASQIRGSSAPAQTDKKPTTIAGALNAAWDEVANGE